MATYNAIKYNVYYAGESNSLVPISLIQPYQSC